MDHTCLKQMKKADLIVSLGERITDSVSQSYTFPKAPQPQLKLVHVWPDPNEVGRVFNVDLGIVAEPASVIRALLRRGAPADAAKRQGWVGGLNAIHRKLMAPEGETMTDGVNFAAVCVEIAKHLAPERRALPRSGQVAVMVPCNELFISHACFL